MKLSLLKLSTVLILCSSSLFNINQNTYVSAEETTEESSVEEQIKTTEIVNTVSYSEGLKSLPKEAQDFIRAMRDKYSDYEYSFDMKDFKTTDKMYKILEDADPSPEAQNKAMFEFLGDNALKNDYDEDESYSETEDGQKISEFLKNLLKEAIEDHQSDKVYMIEQISDVDYANELTDMLDAFTYHYANQSNMLQFIVSQYSVSNMKAQEKYYTEVSKEIGVKINADTDMSELDQKTIDAMYASEAFKKASDPNENPDAKLSKDLASASNVKDWEKALDNLYKIEFSKELSGKDLNMLGNAFNQLRVIRVKYYDIIKKVVDGGQNNNSSVTPTEEGVENTPDNNNSESTGTDLKSEPTEEMSE